MVIVGRIRPVKLRDGLRVRLRPIAPDDKQLCAAAFDRLGESSRYRRYFSHMQALSPELLAYLTEVDHVDHEAIIAIEPGTGAVLGVARFIRTGDDAEAAEVAFAVIDDWQGRGLGRALLTALTKRARQEGVRRFVAHVLYDNDRAIQMLRGVSEIERRTVGREMELAIELPEQRGIGAGLSSLLRAAASGALSGRQLVAALPTGPQPEARSWRSIRAVVVGSDGSPTAAVAVRAALDVAARFGATIYLVAAYRLAEQRPEALRILAGAEVTARGLGIEPVCHAQQGEAAAVLVQVSEDHNADLLVVGSKGMSGAGRLRGSVPNAVSHRAPCSVMIVRTI
jgi:nucleotide-binding universal stress UspA family protein/ribosomal protein S18 acetylase RimI-like enzyme